MKALAILFALFLSVFAVGAHAQDSASPVTAPSPSSDPEKFEPR